jgi:hypothetical protein
MRGPGPATYPIPGLDAAIGATPGIQALNENNTHAHAHASQKRQSLMKCEKSKTSRVHLRPTSSPLPTITRFTCENDSPTLILFFPSLILQ